MAEQSCNTPYGGNCSTSFPAGMIMAGTFNRTTWLAHGMIVGNEMRAMNNIRLEDEEDAISNMVSLSGYGPNLNQPRDPRNGRNGELMGEDGFLTGLTAEFYVRGMQFGNVSVRGYDGPLRMLASLKHFTAYSLETNRMGSQANISMFDLWDTYLPQYAPAMTRSLAAGTMCSYSSIRMTESTEQPLVYVPSCANPYILNTVVRDYWNRPDATHLSDCGAVWNMAYKNMYTNNLTSAAAAALNGGMDMNSNTISPAQLTLAVALNMTNERAVRAAATRLLAQRFRVGQFDPLEFQPELLALGAADIGTTASVEVSNEAVLQGTVLLRNEKGTLPLAAGTRIAVLGPVASSVDALIGDFYATLAGLCPSGNPDDCIVTFAEAIAACNVDGTTVTYAGVSMSGNDTSWGAALASVADSDVVVLALGTDRTVAAEGKDRTDIGLPGVQGAFGVAVLQAARAAGVPVVLVLIHNLPVSFDELVQQSNSSYTPVSAIVDAWAPVAGAPAVAKALFGHSNRWGKSVLTVYPRAYQDAISLFSFDMSSSPGRSYKYYDGSVGKPLVNFGQGMSYSTFSVKCNGTLPTDAHIVFIECNVSNTAGPDGDEVLMVFHRPSRDIVGRVNGNHPLPLQALVGFERVSINAGSMAAVTFQLDILESLTFVNEEGVSVLYPGGHFLDVSNGNGVNITIAVDVHAGAAPEWLGGVRILKRPPTPPRS